VRNGEGQALFPFPLLPRREVFRRILLAEREERRPLSSPFPSSFPFLLQAQGRRKDVPFSPNFPAECLECRPSPLFPPPPSSSAAKSPENFCRAAIPPSPFRVFGAGASNLIPFSESPSRCEKENPAGPGPPLPLFVGLGGAPGTACNPLL